MDARLRAAKHPAFSVLTKTRSLDYGLIRMTLRLGLQQQEKHLTAGTDKCL